MRQIGILNDESQARRFVDFLLTQEIDAQCEQDGSQWLIWIREENQIEQAKKELEEFRDDPQAQRYREAGDAANQLRNKQVRKRIQARKNMVDMRGQWGGPMARRAPLTMALIAISAMVFLFSKGRIGGWPSLLFVVPVQWDQPWRVLTPIFLHQGLIHILFNMYWLYILGGMIESRKGPILFGVLVLAAALGGNFAQAFMGPSSEPPYLAPFGGMSGVVYGLFAYVWLRRHEGYPISQQTMIFIGVFFILGFTGRLGPIANFAHAGGALGGVILAYLPDLPFRRR